jgi:hypothetical protein
MKLNGVKKKKKNLKKEKINFIVKKKLKKEKDMKVKFNNYYF